MLTGNDPIEPLKKKSKTKKIIKMIINNYANDLLNGCDEKCDGPFQKF